MKGQLSAVQLRATCLTCSWSCAEKNAMAIGAQHAERRGHVVEVHQHLTVTFGRRRGPTDPVQTELGLGPRKRRAA